MKEFTTFIVVVFIIFFIALFFSGRSGFGESWKEVTANLQAQVESVHR